MSEKVRTDRLRRKARRRGLRLMKSAVRDPGAIDYGRFRLIGEQDGGMHGPFESLDEVESFLGE